MKIWLSIFFIFSTRVFAETPLLDTQKVIDLLNNNSGNIVLIPVDSTHPDYPIYLSIQQAQNELEVSPWEVIKKLEKLLVNPIFEKIAIQANTGSSLLVNTEGGFSLWREYTYLLLGRAYYRLDFDLLALSYFNAIPSYSKLYSIALIEKSWVHIRLQQYASLNESLKKIERQKPPLSKELAKEVQLLRAYALHFTNQFEKSIQEAKSLSFKENTTLEVLLHRLLAQSYFNIFFYNMESSFSFKKKALTQAVEHLKKITEWNNEADFAYFAGEVYWHSASLHRVEDPEKYEDQWKGDLAKTQWWLSPWIEKSIEKKHPYVKEDALFLYIAALWEQGHWSKAIQPLQSLPQLFPQGHYREDVYQILGDYFYDNKSFKSALTNYKFLTAIGTQEKSTYGLYKAAWSFYNLNEKWAALRHLERLVLFYRNQENGFTDKSGIFKESRNDMMLVLAELSPYKEARGELEIFKFKRPEMVAAIEQISQMYTKLGKFKDGIEGYKELLLTELPSQNHFTWFAEMLNLLLKDGQREQLAIFYQKYHSRLPIEEVANAKLHQESREKAIQLLLTIHKEARKTDDDSIWKATDSFYKVLAQLHPRLENGNFWYYGAQRFERQGQIWEAMKWYRKSSESKDFENKDDAGLSVLRIAQEALDKMSLTQPNISNYQKISEFSQWYIDQFSKSPQRSLAENLVLESLYKSGQSTEATARFTRSIEKDGATSEHQAQFFKHNLELYRVKDWGSSYEFAQATANTCQKLKKCEPLEFITKVNKIAQESAFQVAFQLEKEQSSPDKVRLWYKNAFKIANADDFVASKSWHNYIVHHKVPEDNEAIIEAAKNFLESQLFEKYKHKGEFAELFSPILLVSAKAYQSKKMYLKQAETLYLVSQVIDKKSLKEEVLWESAQIFGSFYEVEKMDKVFEELEKLGSQFVKNPKFQIVRLRLETQNQRVAQTWPQIKSLLHNYVSSTGLLLLRDFYQLTETADPSIHNEISLYLKDNYSRLKNEYIIKDLWRAAFYPNFSEKLSELMSFPDRQPALTTKKNPKTKAFEQLKERLEKVSQTLEQFESERDFLKKELKSSLPEINKELVCLLSQSSETYSTRLESLKSPRIKATQWKDFLARLNSKSKELKELAQKEKEICQKAQIELAFLPPYTQTRSPFCEQTSCLSTKKTSPSYENINLDDQDLLSQVRALLDKGAWATAEFVTSLGKTEAERSLSTAYIRMWIGDTWNAVSLLQEAAKDKSQTQLASLLLARILWSHQQLDLAREKAKSLDKVLWQDWQKVLYEEIRAPASVSEPKMSDESLQ